MKVFVLFHLIAVLCTVALFIRGFFPIKKVSHGFATQKVKINSNNSGGSIVSDGNNGSTISTITSSASSYRRLVLMVIDALRADFAFGPFNYLPKTFEILRNGHGLQFIAKTDPPTVTLPRIKAITTGSPPSFVDVVLNFGSPALEEDNIVTQMKRSGRQIVFYGDDTWINLFPHHFERSDGTTSFFVSDYSELVKKCMLKINEPKKQHNYLLIGKFAEQNRTFKMCNVEVLTREYLSRVDIQFWKKCVEYVLKEDDYWHRDGLLFVQPVDTNVTRHLTYELSNPTWDIMILHYLGLDHIGHLAGPSSPLVKPKLIEMDNVIRQIYSAMELWPEPSLLVVCGDHGMSDQGGHGGASAGEISVPVLLLSPHIVSKDSKHVESISQVDLCPTLSVLLGLPIPKNNMGKVVTEALVDFTLPQKVSVIHQNTVQAMQILKSYVQDLEKESSYLLYSKAKHQFHNWLTARNSTPKSAWDEEGHILLTMYSESLTLLAEKVTRVSTEYDVYAMAVSIALLWMLLASLILNHLKKNITTSSKPVSRYASQLIIAVGTAVLSHITMCTVSVPSDLLCQATPESLGIQLFVGVVFVVCLLIILTEVPKCVSPARQFQAWMAHTCILEMFLLVGTVCHTFTLLSTSFVEEEHQIFYFLTTSVHVLLLAQTAVLLLEGHRDKQLSASKNAANINCKKFEEVNNCGEKIYNSFGGDKISVKTVETDKAKNVQGSYLSHSGDFSCSELNQPSATFGSLKDKEAPSTAHDAVHAGKSVKGNLKKSGECISLTEFLHVSASIVGVLVLLRVLRTWNQTGNKWLDVPDFGDWLILPENKLVLSLSIVFSLMVIGASQGRHLKRVQSMLVNLTLATAYLYRVADGSLFFPSTWFLSQRGIMEARASLFFIGLTIVISILPTNCFRLEPAVPKQGLPALGESCSQIKRPGYFPILVHPRESQQSQSAEKGQKSKEEISREHNQASSFVTSRHKKTSITTSNPGSTSSSSQTREGENQIIFSTHQRLRGVASAFLCFMCVVLRPHNTVLLAMMSLVEQMMTPILINSRMKPTYILLYCLWMGQAFFFFQGNSNSLSTVDLTTGYTGLYEFTPAVTGTLLFLSTHSGIIFWIITYLKIVSLMCDTDTNNLKHRLPVILTRSCNTLLLSRAWPLSVYTALVSTQRYHLFVWTVFSPKLLYEGANTFVICVLAFLLLVYSLFKS